MIRVKIPEQVLAFAREYCRFTNMDLNTFWRLETIDMINALIHGVSGAYFDAKEVIERFNLGPVFIEKKITETKDEE